mgnify:CR=1 FL=1
MTKLPPLLDEAFDGEKHTIEIKETRCSHVVNLVSSIEAKCVKCGVGWTGNNINEIVKFFNKDNS